VSCILELVECLDHLTDTLEIGQDKQRLNKGAKKCMCVLMWMEMTHMGIERQVNRVTGLVAWAIKQANPLVASRSGNDSCLYNDRPFLKPVVYLCLVCSDCHMAKVLNNGSRFS
jgi:hypothetical protein